MSYEDGRPGREASYRRGIEAIKTETVKSPSGEETVSTHPAFAQIAVSRVTATPGETLYGSDFKHNGFMQIVVRRSQEHRNLHRDWYFGREELIAIELSEAQWATFISTPNTGSGAPCTLRHVGREEVPRIEAPQFKHKQFSAEVKRELAGTVDRLKGLIQALDLTKMSVTQREDLKKTITSIIQDLGPNLNYAAKTFDEHVEDSVSRAKAEIEGYLTGAFMRAGVAALADGRSPLELPSGETVDAEPSPSPETDL